MAISWGQFGRVLKAANPRLVLIPSKNLGSMVYLRDPLDPDCLTKEDNPRLEGLVEVMAIASPSFFCNCPATDVEYDDGSGKTKWVRGYISWFRKADKIYKHGGKLIKGDKVKALIPDAFRRFNGAKFKKDVELRNLEKEPEMLRKAHWLKSRAKVMKNNGMTGAEKMARILSASGSTAERAELFDSMYDTPLAERQRREAGMKEYLGKVA